MTQPPTRAEIVAELWRLGMESRQLTKATNDVAARIRELVYQVEQLREIEGAAVLSTDCPPVLPPRLEPTGWLPDPSQGPPY